MTTEEQQDEKEFEEIWKEEEWTYGDKYVFQPLIKRIAKYWFVKGCRTLREQLLKLNNHPKDAKYG